MNRCHVAITLCLRSNVFFSLHQYIRVSITRHRFKRAPLSTFNNFFKNQFALKKQHFKSIYVSFDSYISTLIRLYILPGVKLPCYPDGYLAFPNNTFPVFLPSHAACAYDKKASAAREISRGGGRGGVIIYNAV